MVVREEKKHTSDFRWLESQLDLFGRLAKVLHELCSIQCSIIRYHCVEHMCTYILYGV